LSPEPGSLTGDQALDAYAAQAAHQLGEAVALMRASTTVLERRGPGGPDTRDALRGMLAGIERAQRFVDDLLELTAVGRAEPLVEPVDVAAVLDDVRSDLADPLARAKATVSAGELAAVTADRRHVRRLLMHLTRTALAAGATAVDVSARAEGAGAVIEVRDDGLAPGAAAGDPFAAFARARGRGPLVGAGVSLALCRRIAEAHRGTIALEPRDGSVVVTVTLPGGA
jgi:two-component system OmpR family sensor kinase